MEPLVSILIPARNAEPWIGDTIRSALAQTWQRKEVIVVDDGSTDGTLRTAEHFASRQVAVVTQAPQGAAAARNHAFSLCQGDYVQWLDADDLLAPDKIARQMEALSRRPSARLLLAGAWGHFIYRTRKTTFMPTSLWCDLSPLEWLLRKLEQNLFMSSASWLVSRALTQAAGPWDVRLSLDDDGEYFCRVLVGSEGTHFVPDARVFYRRTGISSLSHAATAHDKLQSRLLSMQLHVAHLRSLDDGERARRACLAYVQRRLIDFYPERADAIRQCEELADALGGRLEVPRLSWKYGWMQRAFGWRLAKQASVWLPALRWSLRRRWDRAMFALEE